MLARLALPLVVVSLCPQRAHADLNLGGVSGLLTVPTAEVMEDGTAASGAARYNPAPYTLSQANDYYVTMSLLPGLEVGGNIVDAPGVLRDLSLDAKYRVEVSGGLALAIGAQDLGGHTGTFRSRYGVATLPLGPFGLSLGYGLGPKVMKGVIGGIEYRPVRFLGVMAEYDADRVNAGLRVITPAMFGGLQIGASAAWRGATQEVEYGVHIEFPLGRREARTPSPLAPLPRGRGENAGDGEALRTTLTNLGFESVRTGSRGPDTVVVALENRRYNQSSADGIGLALGTIAAHAAPEVRQIELTLTTYGVPQTTITVPPGQLESMRVRPTDRVGDDGVRWDGPADRLRSVELVVEPVVRTFVATEFGLVDYGLGLRTRLTAPLASGLIANLGLQAPVVLSDDFRDGRNFSQLAPRAGVDLALLQYLQKISPQWTGLWSAGRAQVYSENIRGVALEQAWVSESGSHQLRAKLMAMRSDTGNRQVALAGYTWFDPVRDYSIGFTGGRFYAHDSGIRLEANRYYGDTICGLFFKAASRDDQAVGVQISLPLTPRQDAFPGLLQVKGPRRWGHSLGTTINSSDGYNHLRPLLLYEPQIDLDLRRDILDSGRLGESYLLDEVPRMNEAYELFSAGR